MAVFPQFERFIWFDGRLRQKRFPNASHLAAQFEISHKTAQRDIIRLRDRLRAPIDYDHSHRGYYYAEEGFDLPRLPATQEEILAVLVARRLLSHTAGGFISEAFRSFSRKFQDAAAALGMDEARLDESFSASWHGFSPVPDKIFKTVAEALIERRMMEIGYHSPGSGANTRRIVEPHHLQHYMASWVLIAYCRLRDDWRKFYLSRIDSLETLPATFDVRPREQWASQLEGAFGIFQGAASIPVTLRFNAFRARWVREQLWHPAQEVRETADGGIELSFPVADFREVKMMVLQFGADVHVLIPEALRDQICDEVARMRELYGPTRSGK
ncbi:MAG: YafY family protein [Syntrophobacteraceae bacterium]|jgi:predicted DNA-binding transcriptional regulator YafY